MIFHDFESTFEFGGEHVRDLSVFALILSLSCVQTNSDSRNISKNLNSVFSGPKVLLFCLLVSRGLVTN